MDYTRPHSAPDPPQVEYTEYADAHGTVGLLEDPTRRDAWLLTTAPVSVER